MLRKRVGSMGLIFGMVLGLWGCPPTLYINNSFRQAVKVPLAAGMISLNRGESIELKEVLKVEKVTPKKLIITRLFGTYYVTANGFRYVWRIAPAGREKASFTKIEVQPSGTLLQPQFLHSESHNCITLVSGEAAAQKKWSIHPSGQVKGKCTDVTSN